MRHRPARSGLVAAAALAAVLGMASPAGAAPAAPHQQTQAAIAAATQRDKIDAAAELGITAGPDLLVLNDRNFVFALWQQAKGREVRASAELAFAAGPDACTQWIKIGVREANRRDQLNQIRDDATATKAKEAKMAAAAVNQIIATPELLIQSNRDFVFAMWERPSGPLLKAAAMAAYQDGTPAKLTEFIETGIFAAREADQKAVRDADQQADAEKKARLAARDARIRAANRLAIEPDEGMLVQPDDGFVMELWDRAQPGSEVRADAERALRDPDEAALTRYIGTGIHAAARRDLLKFLAQKGQADRRLVFELRTRAEQSLVHPALVAAATAALASSDSEVGDFLRVGQYQDSVLTQSLQAVSPGAKGSYLRGVDQATISPGNLTPQPGDGVDATWRVVPGKADATCHSFESVARPEYYLRQHGLKVVIAPSDGTPLFKADATWCTKTGLNGTASLESFSRRGKLLRHFNTLVWAADNLGKNDFETPTRYAEDTSWQVDPPNPTTTAITVRWLNDDALRTRLGDPTSTELADGGVRWRDHQRGRLYWSQATGVHDLTGEILAAYDLLGGHASAVLGLPVTDPVATADGAGRYNDFGNGGSIYWTQATGAHAVYGAIRAKWRSLGAEKSFLGYPTGDEVDIPGGKRSSFQGGRIDLDTATGVATAYPNS
nr:AbfB domain-containing protein [Kibdelosporangium sp. MJ126-NF4]CEL14846.1 Sporulation protein and related proteins [Kibdelosporangium sp. MJ126-NF4]CTQ96523.1 Sporulation protein and related proteins [Kibdelosporangium sp. MJ126-NF4]